MTWPHRDLAAFLGACGQETDARLALDRFTASRAGTSIATVRDALRFMNGALLDRYCAGLAAAGLDEREDIGLRAAT